MGIYVHAKHGLSRLDKIIVVAGLIVLLSVVSTVSLGYFVFSEPSQTGEAAGSVSPTPSPVLTPAPSPGEESAAGVFIPTPSVPEFTVEVVDNSYDVPLTYTYEVDQFTGKELQISHGGYHLDNRSLVFTIKNQPFTSVRVADGNVTSLSYKIRVKGHYGDDWTELNHVDSSGAGYTLKPYILGENCEIYLLRGIASGEVDFQMQALIGYYYETYDLSIHSAMFYWYFPGDIHFVGETSGWSPTQTITIP